MWIVVLMKMVSVSLPAWFNWDFGRPVQLRNQKKKPKTEMALEMAIDEMGLPAEVEVLREAFYRHHGGAKHAPNAAWNRALNNGELVLDGGKLFRQR